MLLSTEDASDGDKSGGTQQRAHDHLLKLMLFEIITLFPWDFGSLWLYCTLSSVVVEERHGAGRTDRWMDGWMDEWVGGWVDGWVDGQIDSWAHVLQAVSTASLL